MKSPSLMSRVLGWAKVSGWAIGLGLVTGRLIYQTDGRYAGIMIAAACAILMWRLVRTIGMPELTRAAPNSPPAVRQAPLDEQLLSRSM